MTDNVNTSTPVAEPTVAPTTLVTETPAATVAPEAAQAAPTNAWIDSLAEDLRGHKSLSTFKDVNELAKSYLNAQSLIGKRISEMSAEDLAHVNALKGVPVNPAEYTLPEEVNPELGDWYKNIAHKAGLTKDQAKHVLDSYVELNRQMEAKHKVEMENSFNQSVAALQKEFGSAFDQRIEVAKRAVDAFGGQELKDLLNQTGLGNNPTVVKMFAKIGKELLNDQIITADHEKTFGLTPDDAKREMNNKLLDAEFRAAYYSATHPGHKAAVEEMARLMGMMGSKG